MVANIPMHDRPAIADGPKNVGVSQAETKAICKAVLQESTGVPFGTRQMLHPAQKHKKESVYYI